MPTLFTKPTGQQTDAPYLILRWNAKELSSGPLHSPESVRATYIMLWGYKKKVENTLATSDFQPHGSFLFGSNVHGEDTLEK